MVQSFRARLALLCAVASSFAAACASGGGSAPYDGTTGGTHSISGVISGATLVTVVLDGPQSATTITDALGRYRFDSLPDGDYLVTASRSPYTISPAYLTVNLSGADVTGQNFTATPPAYGYTLSGRVSGAIADDVTIKLGGRTELTVGGGLYSFVGVANGSYVLEPSKPGYVFTPSKLAVNFGPFTLGMDAVCGIEFAITASWA